jgi:hypothetical protein
MPETRTPDQPDDETTDLSRRQAIKKGALVGGVLWAAPAIQTIGMSSAFAQAVSPGGGCVCTGTNSFDVTATFTGLVSGTVGPIQDFPADSGCVADLAVRAPGRQNPFLTATAACVGGTTTGGTCSAFVELNNLAVDLRQVIPSLDVQLNASVVRAEASCTCGGGCTASACITQANGQAIVEVGDQVLAAGTGVQVCNSPVTLNVNLPGVDGVVGPTTGTVQLLQTSSNPCQATVARISLTVQGLPLLNIPPSTVEIIIARATAVCSASS